MGESRPPLHALIQRCDVDRSEASLLTAMSNHCREGEYIVSASRERLAAWAKLSTKTVGRLIYGWVDSRTQRRHKGLCERGILTELVKPCRFRNSAKYRINVFALSTDPRVKRYLDRDRERARQMNLPEIVKTPKAGIPQQPVSDAPLATQGTPCLAVLDTVSVDHGTPRPPDLKACTDLKAFDLGAAAELLKTIQVSGYALPKTPQLLQSMAGALDALVTAGKSPPDASDFLLAVTLDAIRRGQLINRFWFEDAKWRKANASTDENRSGLRQATLLGNRDIARARIVDRRSTDDLS